MDTKTISLLREWAKTYNTESFIKDDPVRFPHRFTEKRDIEISAFLTAWISYGRRAHILQKAEELHRLMGESPYEFIRTGETSFAPLRNRPVRGRDTFYRFYIYHDLHLLCCRLKDIYDTYDCMEDAMAAAGPCEDPILRLRQLFADLNGIPVLHGTSACKRLAMFLRWMVRTDGTVDLGIWRTAVHPRQLIIPLDTHVHQISFRLIVLNRRDLPKACVPFRLGVDETDSFFRRVGYRPHLGVLGTHEILVHGVPQKFQQGIIVMINIEDYDRIEVETELFPSDDLQKFL